MAMTQEAQISITMQDEIGVKAAITEYLLVDPAMTVTQAVALFQANVGLIDLVTDAAPIHGRFELVITPSGVKASPVAGSRVEQTGLFTLSNSANPRSFGQDIPGWSNSKIVSGHIPIGDTDVDNLTDEWETPGALSEFTNNHFNPLVAVRKTAITFRKRRRLESQLTTTAGDA